MKIITNTVESESLNEEILDSDLNTETVDMKDMEGKVESLNGEVSDTLYLPKLETDQIKKVPNGLTNGFKESSDKSTTHNNKPSDFDDISDDDFHLELEDSDEENRVGEIHDQANQSDTGSLNVEVLISKTTVPEKNSSSSESNIEVDETEDILGVDESELVSKDLISSESMTLVESDHEVRLDSLLDCKEPTKTCSNDEQKAEETTNDECTFPVEPSNLENSDEAIEVNDEQKAEETTVDECNFPVEPSNLEDSDEVMEVNDVFSEVVIENDETDGSSEKTKQTDDGEKLDDSDSFKSTEENKFEDSEMYLNVDAEVKTVGNHLDGSEKCISEDNFKNSMELDCNTNKPSDLENSFSTPSDNLLKPPTSTTFDISNDLILPVNNSLKNSNDVEHVAETKLDEDIIMQNEEPKVVDTVNGSHSEENTIVEIDTKEKSLDEFVNINTKEDDSVSLDADINSQHVKSIETKLTKSPSGDEIFLNDVMESVVENFEEQKNSFDDDDFEDMDLASSIKEVDSSNVASPIKGNKEVSSSQESGSTVNNPEEWMILDELNEISSSDEQTDTLSGNINSLPGDASCEIQEDHEVQIEESDSIHTDVCFSDDIEIEETKLEDVEESSTVAVEQLVSLKDGSAESDGEDTTKMDVETSVSKDIPNENAIMTVEESGLKVVDSITLSDVDTNPNDSNKETIILSNEETNNVSVEESISKEIDPIALNNEEVDTIEFEEFVSTDIDSTELKCVDDGSNMDIEMSEFDEEKENININESGTNASDSAALSNEIDGEKITENIKPIILSKEGLENDVCNLVNDAEDVSVDSKNVSLDNPKEEPFVEVETDESLSKSGETLKPTDSDCPTEPVDKVGDVTSDCVIIKDSPEQPEKIEDNVHPEDKESVSLTEDSERNVLKEKPLMLFEKDDKSDLECMSIEDDFCTSLKVEKDLKNEESEQSNKEIQSKTSVSNQSDTISPVDNISLSETPKNTEEDVSDALRKRSASSSDLDDVDGAETKRFKHEVRENSLEVENDADDVDGAETKRFTLEVGENMLIENDAISVSNKCNTGENDAISVSNECNTGENDAISVSNECNTGENAAISVSNECNTGENAAISVSNECNTDENDVEITPSSLKRTNSGTKLASDIVKKPKLNSSEETDLSVCCNVMEECLKFAETNNSISDNLKGPLLNDNLDTDKACITSVPGVSDSSDSISDIKNSVKSSIETTDSDKSDISNSRNNKFRRKDVIDVESKVDLDSSKKVTVPTKSKEESQSSRKTVTNLDLAIERVVEQSRVDPEKKVPLLKRFHKDQLKNLTRHDLEELIIVKLCEAITDRSVIGELRLRCHKIEQIHEQWKKKAMQLEKSHRELEMVLKRYLLEASNTKKERQPLPIKVTRSVGLQVVLASSGHVSRQKSSSHSQQSSQHRRQLSGSNKASNSPISSTPKPPLPVSHWPRKMDKQQPRLPNTVDSEVKENDNPFVSWIYKLSKPELEEEMRKANLPLEGTVREMRPVLAAFIRGKTLPPSGSSKVEEIEPGHNLVSGPGKSSKPSLNQAVPQQKPSGIKVLTPRTNQVDLSPAKTPVPPRSRPSTSTASAPTPSPKAGSLEVIDLTDKEEKNKQLQQKQQQQAQQQKLKQQLILQQQQQKQKQQILQQKQQQQKQLLQQNHQAKQMTQQVKQPTPIQNTPNKQLQQQQQQKQQSPQQNVGVRVPTSVQQNGLRLVQTHQLTTNSPAQGIQAILVPTSAGQNGTTRPPQLFIATPSGNQLRASMPVIQSNRPTTSSTPISINGNSTVMLRTGHVIPLQQTAGGVLRSPPAALPIMNPRTGIQQIRPPQPVYKHPAPLPANTQHVMKPGMKLPPPKPQLKIAKTVNGIMLSWSMAIAKDVADIASYQLYAYQESSQPPNTALWKKVGDVKALPLPMACTLTQFVEGHKYHFSVRAVDVHSRIGPFSVPGSILLTSGK